jgi:hypothetical protein
MIEKVSITAEINQGTNLTPIGRATARLLAMNAPERVELRQLRGIGGR